MADKILYTVITPTADILAAPEAMDIISNDDSQLLYGEAFEAIEQRGDTLYGRAVLDGYTGHVRAAHLAPATITAAATHTVCAVKTHLYPAPDFKTRPVMALSFQSRLSIDESAPSQNNFVKTAGGHWVCQAHLAPLPSLPRGASAPVSGDAFLQIALRFIGTPYLYGGRSAFGIDCSGLVQVCLQSLGVQNCPRDSKDQATSLGTEIATDTIQRGDLVFFKGHVGMMTDGHNILNATARTMDVRVEPLAELVDFYKEIKAVRRI